MKKILFYSTLLLFIISCQTTINPSKLASVIYIDEDAFESFGVSTKDVIYKYENQKEHNEYL